MKICKDCVYYELAFDRSFCSRNIVKSEDINLVTGAITIRESGERSFCDTERYSEGESFCGKEGRCFELVSVKP